MSTPKGINDIVVAIQSARDDIKQFLTKFYADTRYSSDVVPFRQQRFTIKLEATDPTTGLPTGTATNPYKLGFPVTALRVEVATDNSTEINVSLNGDSTQQIANYTVMKKNDVMKFDKSTSQMFLTWNAQAGKTITLIAYVDVTFESGTQVSTISGGVNITTGSGMTPGTPVAVTSTATQILASDSDRKNAVIGNPRLSGVDVWISGTSAVDDESGANPGILLEPGDYYEYQGQGDIYGITSSGTCNVTIQTES